MFDAMSQPEHPVHDDDGRQIGTVQLVAADGPRTRLWRSRALDGADLGTFSDRDDACGAIRLDWMLGRPRHPRTHERYRAEHAHVGGVAAPPL